MSEACSNSNARMHGLSSAQAPVDKKQFGYSTLWNYYTGKVKPVTWLYERNLAAGIIKRPVLVLVSEKEIENDEIEND